MNKPSKKDSLKYSKRVLVEEERKQIEKFNSDYKVGDTIIVNFEGIQGYKSRLVSSKSYEFIAVVELESKNAKSVRVVIGKTDLSIVTPEKYWKDDTSTVGTWVEKIGEKLKPKKFNSPLGESMKVSLV